MKKRLAWFDRPRMQGHIRIHPAVRAHPTQCRGIQIHMETAQKVMSKTGDRNKAIRAGLDAEHKRKSLEQVRKYELENARLQKQIEASNK
jgi:hypothetical protein